jgi:hypothetical protein
MSSLDKTEVGRIMLDADLQMKKTLVVMETPVKMRLGKELYNLLNVKTGSLNSKNHEKIPR